VCNVHRGCGCAMCTEGMGVHDGVCVHEGMGVQCTLRISECTVHRGCGCAMHTEDTSVQCAPRV
jgi:hypothetical protein